MASFILSEKEEKSSKMFRENHKSCGTPRLFNYILTPNGIGVSVKIACPYCGESEDITDVDCW